MSPFGFPRETRFKPETINAGLEDGYLDATTLMEHLVARKSRLKLA